MKTEQEIRARIVLLLRLQDVLGRRTVADITVQYQIYELRWMLGEMDEDLGGTLIEKEPLAVTAQTSVQTSGDNGEKTD